MYQPPTVRKVSKSETNLRPLAEALQRSEFLTASGGFLHKLEKVPGALAAGYRGYPQIALPVASSTGRSPTLAITREGNHRFIQS